MQEKCGDNAWGKAEVLNDYFVLSFSSRTSCPLDTQLHDLGDREGKKNVVITIKEEIVSDLLHQLDSHKCMRAKELHSRLPEELTDVFTKLFFSGYLWRSQRTERQQMRHPCIRKDKKKIWGTMYLSVWHLYQRRLCKRSPQVPLHTISRTSRGSGPVSTGLWNQVLLDKPDLLLWQGDPL